MESREIDKLVAEKVMGWELSADGKTLISPQEGRYDASLCTYPEYSTNIEEAWKVVKKFGCVDIHLDNDGCRVRIYEELISSATAESAPMAICLSALALKGVEVE